MRRVSCLSLLATSVLLGACSDGGGSGSPADDFPQADGAAFTGSWQSPCVADGEGYRTETLAITGDVGSLQYRAHTDAGCTQPLFMYETPFTLTFGDSLALPDGSSARAVDVTYEAPVTFTPLTVEGAGNLSANRFCDFDGYAVDVSVDVTDCPSASEFAARIGQMLVQTAAVELVDGRETLFLGEDGSEVVDATEPRPSVLDRSTPYVRVDG